jgi:hypothetical protein
MLIGYPLDRSEHFHDYLVCISQQKFLLADNFRDCFAHLDVSGRSFRIGLVAHSLQVGSQVLQDVFVRVLYSSNKC